MSAVRAYVALGSNLGDPRRQVETALEELRDLPRSTLAAHSRLYRSAPMGPSGQPDYVNAVAGLDTELAPEALLRALQAIEAGHGRERGAERWGPRTLDLDVLLYGELQQRTEVLTIPHPGLHERNFVLYPLHEIAPELNVPGRGPLAALLAGCPGGGLHVLGEE